jgi:hypothetical protein
LRTRLNSITYPHTITQPPDTAAPGCRTAPPRLHPLEQEVLTHRRVAPPDSTILVSTMMDARVPCTVENSSATHQDSDCELSSPCVESPTRQIPQHMCSHRGFHSGVARQILAPAGLELYQDSARLTADSSGGTSVDCLCLC